MAAPPPRSLRALVAAVLLGGLAGCARRPAVAPLPSPPSGLLQIAVAEPVNRTGHDLRLDDHGPVALVLGPNHSTVPELLALDLRTALATRRFNVVPVKGPVPVLRIELRRWDPDAADYSTATVDLTASVVEPSSGRAL